MEVVTTLSNNKLLYMHNMEFLQTANIHMNTALGKEITGKDYQTLPSFQSPFICYNN